MPKQNKTKPLSEAKREFYEMFNTDFYVDYEDEPYALTEKGLDELWKLVKSLLKKQRVRDREGTMSVIEEIAEVNTVDGLTDYKGFTTDILSWFSTLKSYKLKKR